MYNIYEKRLHRRISACYMKTLLVKGLAEKAKLYETITVLVKALAKKVTLYITVTNWILDAAQMEFEGV